MKNKYDDAIREAFLKSAFGEAARQDIAELEAMNIEVRYPTEKQKREIQREIRKVERGSSRGFSRFGRAVAMIAIVCCLVFGAIMTQPAVRASVWDVVVSFFEKYLSFDFDKNEIEYEYQLGDYQVAYIPEGFNLEESSETFFRKVLVFKSGEKVINISLSSSPFSQVSTDVENGKAEGVFINDMPGYLLNYEDDSMKQVLWGNEECTFIIFGDVTEKEIIKIAKNIR